jgi:hypothetical protein
LGGMDMLVWLGGWGGRVGLGLIPAPFSA